MKNNKIAYVSMVSFLTLAVLFFISPKVSAFNLIYTFDGNLFSVKEYTELPEEIRSLVDPEDWPVDQAEPNLEAEDGNELPDFTGSGSPFFLKYKNTTYVFDSAPQSWDDLETYNIYGISSYYVPEPSDMILLGLLLLSFVIIQRKKVFK